MVTKKQRFHIMDIILGIFMILVMGAILIPFIHMIAVSLSSNGPVMRGEVSLWPKGFTLDMYKHIMNDNKFFTAYSNTIQYTLIGTTISLVITAMGAYALSRKEMVGNKLFSIMITITMFFGGGMIPTYLVVKNYGLLDTMWAVVLPGAVTTWNLIVMRSFFDAFPKEIVESGMVDGLNDAGVFFRLVLPTSKAVLATIGLYYAVSLWNAYFIPFIYLNSPDLYPLQVILQQMLTAGISEASAVEDTMIVAETLKYASVIVAITPIMCVYPFLQKYFVKGVLVGSVKG